MKDITRAKIVILIPTFNDWEALEKLIIRLDDSLVDNCTLAEIIIVDDASSILIPNNFLSLPLKNISQVSVLELKRNLGHQRAIAIGLAYVAANLNCEAVVVMDGDGEDNPKDVPRLINNCREESYTKVIFARRTTRSETYLFKCFYLVYKLLYKLLTGYEIRVGNFSIIPYKVLCRIVVISEIWNHYAAGLLKARIPYAEISTKRSNRLIGRSKMNFVSLVTHGVSSISVYADVVGTRLLILTAITILSIILLLLFVLIVRIFTNWAIPGWASYMFGLLCSILLQNIMLSVVFVLMILNTRNSYGFIILQDYHYFILSVKEVFSNS
jgi:polyisoprenyl-phosphate glycosyltransferase